MKILIGTKNEGKIIEMKEALNGVGHEFVSPKDVGIHDDPEETGDTFHDNARLKAQHYYKKSGLPTLADDSGIIVEALQNELGIHTRRWGAGPSASDEEWISYFLERMQTEENKKARFMCVLCFIDETGTEIFFEGTCEGVIDTTCSPRYLPGLPLSGCFIPSGFSAPFSDLTIEQKNSTSHRGRAAEQLRQYFTRAV